MTRAPVASPDDDLPPPDGGVRPRVWHHDAIPPPGRPLVNSISGEILGIAIEVHNDVADPQTGKPHAPNNVNQSVAVAVDVAWTAAQEDAQRAARPIDDAFVARAATAAHLGGEALALMAETDAIPHQMVEAPSRAQLSRRQVAHEHRADDELARRHEAEGDHRHRQREVPRWVVVVGAVVYGLVDLLLLYVPVLNLGEISDTGDVVRWGVAIVLSMAQAILLELALNAYRQAEREGTDLRNAVRDRNHDVTADRRAADVDPVDIAEADARLVRAQYWLVSLAGITGVLTAFRIAILVREALRPNVEAALFGAAIGLVLGLLVLVLGRALCRGNALGDRLTAGGEVIAETDELVENGLAEVRDTRSRIDACLTAARKARGRGDEVRYSIVAAYKQGIERALIWLEVPEFTDSGVHAVTPREIPVVRDGELHVKTAEAAHKRIATWLGEDTDVTPRRQIEPAPPTHVEPAPTGPKNPVYTGQTAGSKEFPSRLQTLTPMPPEPRVLLGAVAALTLAAAVVGAVYAPGIEATLAAAPWALPRAVRSGSFSVPVKPQWTPDPPRRGSNS